MDLDTEAVPEEALSRRETIEAAFAAADEPPAEVVMPEPVEAATPGPTEPAEKVQTAAEKARDRAGRFAKAKAVAPVKSAVKAAPVVTKKPALVPVAPVAPAPATTTGTTPPAPGETSAALKPPASWKPAARERWNALPAEVQQEAVRRERETQAALQESSEARKSWSSFQQAVAPYAGMFQAEGASPIQAAASLFQTAAALRTAPPPAKARIVADIVRTYGIDIGMLDQALAGQAPQQSQGQQPQGQFRDPRVDELMSRLQNGERQRQEAAAQKAAGEVHAFGANAEFYEDVRQDMAYVLEDAARRGVAMSIEDAYSRAVKLHPEVSKVMAQREEAKAATATQATTQRARAAASSVKSRPTGPAPTVAPTGRRAALDAAWDAHSR